MKILVTGATGFIGARLRDALAARGHELVGVARRVPADAQGTTWIALDFGRARAEDWRAHLQGVDAVVNAVGIFREQGGQTFQRLHVDGAVALFEACVQSGVRRVVQVSALGADAGAATAYHLSKRAADERLLALPLDAAVVQPSLVFDADGPSAGVFLAWAALPVLAVPAGGRQALQPVHVDDVVGAVAALVERLPQLPHRGARVPLVGPAPTTLTGYLQSLRTALGLRCAPVVSVPAAWVAAAARVGDRLPSSLLDRASWQMLQRGNTAPADAITALLGRPPRAPERFLAPAQAEAARRQALLQVLLPLLRLSIAFVWILTGIVSMGPYPVEQSLELLARSGVPPAWRPAALYGAAALDLLLGVLTLWPLRRRRWLWGAQAALIATYTLIISIRLPEFWLHPYGPLSKNVPMLAALLLLAMLEPARRGR